MALFIHEKEPNGDGSIKQTLKWVEDITANVSDPTPFFKGLVPDIKDALRFTFSEGNPNQWIPLGAKYKAWKATSGFPVTIGILTGAMKRSWVETPEISMIKKKMKYTFDKTEVGYQGKPLVEYIDKFNEKRPILPYSIRWIKKNMKKVALDVKTMWIAKNKTFGNSD